MDKLPVNLIARYTAFLVANGIDTNQHQFYLKWLRYYLDFCTKYSFNWSEFDSLPAFVIKLKSKNQQSFLVDQAKKAVGLLRAMEKTKGTNQVETVKAPKKSSRSYKNQPSKKVRNESKLSASTHGASKIMHSSKSVEKEVKGEVQNCADWTQVYTELENAIKIRHYSPKTLKSYVGYTRQFQAFVKSKNLQLVEVEDVKEFLTYMAVKKKVSASSQNLAFNALLFLFRNVFKTEFGKIDGIVRAKRRPYIPVVLSRGEVDRILSLLQDPYRLMIKLMYGCGLRISECISLRVHNFNFDMGILTIHDGKGKKDRTVPIPETLRKELEEQF